jgi:hypothetical protein
LSPIFQPVISSRTVIDVDPTVAVALSFVHTFLGGLPKNLRPPVLTNILFPDAFGSITK